MNETKIEKREIKEKIISPMSGWGMLAVILFLIISAVVVLVLTIVKNPGDDLSPMGVAGLIYFIVALIVGGFMCKGFKLVNPNEAVVLTLFGKYHGTINKEGFYYVNPFANSFAPSQMVSSLVEDITVGALSGNTPSKTGKIFNRKISLKAMTLNNAKQKVNDLEGNPIEIGVVVIWRIRNTAQAVFNVENYQEFVSTQTDASIRHIARLYPYDIGESEESDEKSLRASSAEIADEMRLDLQRRVDFAGIEIMEARIAHLAYAPEIAAVMLQRQQAKAIIVARQKIVEGAVGMVEMALNKLSEKNVVELDDERKAQMVSNLLVVLCGNKDASPVVNSGSIY